MPSYGLLLVVSVVIRLSTTVLPHIDPAGEPNTRSLSGLKTVTPAPRGLEVRDPFTLAVHPVRGAGQCFIQPLCPFHGHRP